MVVKVRRAAAHLNAVPKTGIMLPVLNMSLVPLPEYDSSLEQANEIFWQSLLDHVRREFHWQDPRRWSPGCRAATMEACFYSLRQFFVPSG